jgi:hypothetical protein
MISRPDMLRRSGEVLYGDRWQTPLSRDLGVTDRTIRNWAAGRQDCPSDLPQRLLRVVRARGENVEHLILLLERSKDGQN